MFDKEEQNFILATNVGLGKDHTLFATTDGKISFKKTRKRTFVSVIPRLSIYNKRLKASHSLSMKFLDQAKIYVTSGKGGRGCVSFRKEKYIEFGGPNGGNGGKGGNIIIVEDPNLNTLIDFRYQQHFKAKKGENGKGQNQTGANGKNIIIKVPPGTQIFNEDKSVLLADLVEKNDQIIIAQRW